MPKPIGSRQSKSSPRSGKIERAGIGSLLKTGRLAGLPARFFKASPQGWWHVGNRKTKFADSFAELKKLVFDEAERQETEYAEPTFDGTSPFPIWPPHSAEEARRLYFATCELDTRFVDLFSQCRASAIGRNFDPEHVTEVLKWLGQKFEEVRTWRSIFQKCWGTQAAREVSDAKTFFDQRIANLHVAWTRVETLIARPAGVGAGLPGKPGPKPDQSIQERNEVILALWQKHKGKLPEHRKWAELAKLVNADERFKALELPAVTGQAVREVADPKRHKKRPRKAQDGRNYQN